jgi:hypothetical protein
VGGERRDAAADNRKDTSYSLVNRIEEDPASAISFAYKTAGFYLFMAILILAVAIAPVSGIVWVYFTDPHTYKLLSTFEFSFATLWVLSFSWVGLNALGWALDQYGGGRLAKRYLRYLEGGGEEFLNVS